MVCLQELKAENGVFPAEPLTQLGYEAVWRSQRSWNGVAILTRTALPGDPDGARARYIEAAAGGVLIACLYLPNGNPRPGPKFDYKLAWLERLIAHARDLEASGAPVVLAGDYNVVPTEAVGVDGRPRWRAALSFTPVCRGRGFTRHRLDPGGRTNDRRLGRPAISRVR